jgi:hypothetical protein
MELRECRFYYGGQDMNFAVYSDVPCRAIYVGSISLPLAQSRVDIYEMEPNVKTQWIVIKQRDGDKENLKFFVKKGDKYLESELHHLSKNVLENIVRRFPKLSAEFKPSLAA